MFLNKVSAILLVALFVSSCSAAASSGSGSNTWQWPPWAGGGPTGGNGNSDNGNNNNNNNKNDNNNKPPQMPPGNPWGNMPPPGPAQGSGGAPWNMGNDMPNPNEMCMRMMAPDNGNEPVADKSVCSQNFRLNEDLCPGDMDKMKMRWFYCPRTKMCRPFIGCKPSSVGNNFPAFMACTQVCGFNGTGNPPSLPPQQPFPPAPFPPSPFPYGNNGPSDGGNNRPPWNMGGPNGGINPPPPPSPQQPPKGNNNDGWWQQGGQPGYSGQQWNGAYYQPSGNNNYPPSYYGGYNGYNSDGAPYWGNNNNRGRPSDYYGDHYNRYGGNNGGEMPGWQGQGRGQGQGQGQGRDPWMSGYDSYYQRPSSGQGQQGRYSQYYPYYRRQQDSVEDDYYGGYAFRSPLSTKDNIDDVVDPLLVADQKKEATDVTK